MNSKKIFFIIFLSFSLQAMTEEQKGSFKESFEQYYNYLVGSLDTQSWDSPLPSPRDEQSDDNGSYSSSDCNSGSLTFNLPQSTESMKAPTCPAQNQEIGDRNEEKPSLLKKIFCCFVKSNKPSPYEPIE